MQLKSRLRPRTGPCRRHCIGTYNLSRSVSNFDARVMSRGGRDWRSRVAPALNPFINAAGAPQAFSEKSRKSRFGTKPVSFELSRLGTTADRKDGTFLPLQNKSNAPASGSKLPARLQSERVARRRLPSRGSAGNSRGDARFLSSNPSEPLGACACRAMGSFATICTRRRRRAGSAQLVRLHWQRGCRPGGDVLF